MKIVKNILLLLIFLTSSILLASTNGTAEVWLKIYYSNNNPMSTRVDIFEKDGSGYVYFDHGYSTNYWRQNNSNAYGDLGDNNSSGSTWNAMSFNKSYLIKIENKYCRITIGSPGGSPDIAIKYKNGVFTVVDYSPVISMSSQGNWNEKTVTVKNSFNAGKVYVDNILENSGVTKNFGEPTFPHILKAKLNQWDARMFKLRKIINLVITIGKVIEGR